MAKVILDVPADKVQPFLSMVVKLGLEQNSISAFALQRARKKRHLYKYVRPLPGRPQSWEFYKNELEFE